MDSLILFIDEFICFRDKKNDLHVLLWCECKKTKNRQTSVPYTIE